MQFSVFPYFKIGMSVFRNTKEVFRFCLFASASGFAVLILAVGGNLVDLVFSVPTRLLIVQLRGVARGLGVMLQYGCQHCGTK